MKQDFEPYIESSQAEAIQSQPNPAYYVIGGLIGLFVMIVIAVSFSQVRHWSFVPISVCCIFLSPMVFVWLIGKRNSFDPLCLSTLVLTHLLVVTPLIHLIVGDYGELLPLEGDRNSLMGKVMIICVAGLFCFFAGYSLSLGKRFADSIFSRPAVPSVGRLDFCVVLMLVFAFLAYAYALIVYSGAVRGDFETRYSFTQGKALLFLLVDMIPSAILFWVLSKIIKIKSVSANMNVLLRGAIISRFFIALLIIIAFVGLRGSRSLIMIHILWAVGIYHFLVKRVRASTMVISFLLLLWPLHVYSLYKSFGTQGLYAAFNPAERERLEKRAGRSMLGTIVGDLGRMNVWMFVKQEIDAGNYPLRWGKTYVAAVVTVIPHKIWPSRPNGMNEVITDMRAGRGAYAGMSEKTTMIAGLVGEAYANFKWHGVLFAFFSWGIVIKFMKSLVDRWENDPMLVFLLPVLIYMSVSIVSGDTMTLVFSLVKFLGPSFIVVWFSRIKVNLPDYNFDYQANEFSSQQEND
ncbi:MAG: hypothetical protein KJ757_00515 [Planctomycetes bacterium]|nr:hypothetical protein [Planctomycetota bacterium]MBU1518339.1 hypothetical protein [Planctomycetota bacterium]MBU2458568.1 hypothetical protein [Planctomycetota bacterium]MBU2596038.1 hypothetical protein [Planctomycetota bacterium]